MPAPSEFDRWLEGLSQIVQEVLWRDWDPCDVNEDPDTKSQYAVFVPGVLRLLLNESSPAQIADHLWKLEEEDLKLSVSTADVVDAANMLANEALIYQEEHPRPNVI